MTTVDRTPKPCPHKKPHRHGERVTFKVCGCRCYACSTANSTYQRRHDLNRLYGRATTTLVDANPVRAHVQQLSAAGMGRRTIAAAAGVPESNLVRLLYGRNGAPPSRRCNPDFAHRVLAVQIPTATQLADNAVVDPTGARRRLQALACLGWSISRLADESGLDRQRLDRALRGEDVLVSTVRAVTAIYEQLWDQRPKATTHADKVAVSRAVNRAARAGWAPPAAWDDDTIDDPAAVPATGYAADDVDEHALELVLDGQPMRLTGRDLEEAVFRLTAASLDAAAIAGRVRSDEATVRRARNTTQQRAARAARRDAV